MPPLPKKKRTPGKQGRRRSHFQLQPVSLSVCPHCRTPRPSHRVCPSCGYYAGREVIAIGREEQQSET
ncbi:MAG: 50S ribosomal protein L32 [Dehalococcoidia bacterium]|nr:50S ribosomal protein L32 [Dehalococcoidia bacterium]